MANQLYNHHNSIFILINYYNHMCSIIESAENLSDVVAVIDL